MTGLPEVMIKRIFGKLDALMQHCTISAGESPKSRLQTDWLNTSGRRLSQ